MSRPPVRHFHPWHDLPTVAQASRPRHRRDRDPQEGANKYELDKHRNLPARRLLHSSVHYPGDYGFLPRTLAGDGDPIDVLVLMTAPTFTGCLVEVRPIGVFHLVDKGEEDEKIIAVPIADPYMHHVHDLKDVPPHDLKEIEHFFLVYKDLEGTITERRGFEDAAPPRSHRAGAAALLGRNFPARLRGRRCHCCGAPCQCLAPPPPIRARRPSLLERIEQALPEGVVLRPLHRRQESELLVLFPVALGVFHLQVEELVHDPAYAVGVAHNTRPGAPLECLRRSRSSPSIARRLRPDHPPPLSFAVCSSVSPRSVFTAP